jgi:hypothetical protein
MSYLSNVVSQWPMLRAIGCSHFRILLCGTVRVGTFWLGGVWRALVPS